ncbi:MAG: hypothetical protein AB1Z98_34545 [Nannocystaceae bacterium]
MNDEWRAYQAYPWEGSASGQGRSRSLSLYLPPIDEGGILKLEEDGDQNVGAVRFEIESPTAVLTIFWVKDDRGNPVAPKKLRFSPQPSSPEDPHVDVVPGSGFHTCVFKKPPEDTPGSSWDLVIDEPTYRLTVTVKRK